MNGRQKRKLRELGVRARAPLRRRTQAISKLLKQNQNLKMRARRPTPSCRAPRPLGAPPSCRS